MMQFGSDIQISITLSVMVFLLVSTNSLWTKGLYALVWFIEEGSCIKLPNLQVS